MRDEQQCLVLTWERVMVVQQRQQVGGTHSCTAVPLTLHRHLIHKDAIHGPIPLLVGSNLLFHNLQRQQPPFSLQRYAWRWLGKRRHYDNMHMQLVAGGTSTMGGLQ